MGGDEIMLFIVIMTVIAAASMMALSWMRGRQRLAEMSAAGAAKPETAREVELLSDENAGLKNTIGRLEARLATLEQIVTDPAERTAREIEALR